MTEAGGVSPPKNYHPGRLLQAPDLIIFAPCSATPYTEACGLTRGTRGMMLASHTRRFFVPYTLSFASTTPPNFFGIMEQAPVKWCAPTAVRFMYSFALPRSANVPAGG